MEKEIRNTIAKLNEIKKELVTSKWNFKSFDETIEDIKVDLDVVKENDFINIIEEAYLVEAFSKLKEKRSGNIGNVERGNLIKISKTHGNLLRLKLFFYLELKKCIVHIKEYNNFENYILIEKLYYNSKSHLFNLLKFCVKNSNNKFYVFERLFVLIYLYKRMLGVRIQRSAHNYLSMEDLLTSLNLAIIEINEIFSELDRSIEEFQGNLTTLNFISEDTLSKFGKYININNFCEEFDRLLSEGKLLISSEWFKNKFNCVAILDINKERYVTKNGVDDGEKLEISSNAFKIKNILETLLTRKYISINSNVRYYMEDLKFITYEKFINSDKTNKPNRMFSCCERKLFTMLSKNIGKNIHLVVAKELCVMCERALEYYKTNNINMEIEVVENYSSLSYEDLKKFDDIAYEIYNKYQVKNIIYSENNLVDKYKECRNIFSSKDDSCLKVKNYILKKIREHNPKSNSIKYEGNSYTINDDKVEVDIDFYLNNIKNYDVKEFNGEDVGFFIEEFALDTMGRPKGASVIVLKYEKSRRKLKNPRYWDIVNMINEETDVFHRGHILPGAIVDYIYKKYDKEKNKTLKSIFIQTKWSNENYRGQNKYNQYDLIEKPIIEYLKDSKCNGKCCIYMKAALIYPSETAIIPIGNHIQAKTHCSCGKCDSISLNRFLPNITPDYIIDYETGKLI